jgi:Kef-type K+ transport system membrane component KefB
LFFVGAIAAVLAMNLFQLNLPLRLAAVLLPAAPGIAWILALIRDIRLLDEMQQRIYLEAMAVAFAGTFLLTVMYPPLHKAGFVPECSPVSVSVVMVVLAAASYLIAKRRY